MASPSLMDAMKSRTQRNYYGEDDPPPDDSNLSAPYDGQVLSPSAPPVNNDTGAMAPGQEGSGLPNPYTNVPYTPENPTATPAAPPSVSSGMNAAMLATANQVRSATGTDGAAGSGGFDVNQLKSAWLSSGGRTPQDLSAFIKAHPEFASGVTIGGSKGNKLYYNGQFLADVIQGTSGPNPMAAWDTGTGGSGDAGGGTGGSQGGDTGLALLNLLAGRLLPGGDRSGGVSANLGSEGSSAIRSALEQELLKFIHENSSTTTPNIHETPEAQAYQNQQQRNSEYLRSALAERYGAEGLGNTQGGGGSGAFDTEASGINQSRGEAQAQYEANLAHTILTDRATRLQQALSMGAGYLNSDQALQLQAELQRTNAALEMSRLLLSNQQFYDDLGFRIGSKEADLNTGSTASLL